MKRNLMAIILALCLLGISLAGAEGSLPSPGEAQGQDPGKAIPEMVTFGRYPQTAGGKDKTPIEWLVLDYDAANNRALIISRYGLAAKPYNAKLTEITWEDCTLRTWLNKDFLKTAFTAQEQEGILLTDVDNSRSEGAGWNNKGGNNTQDRIFLLSAAEAKKYLGVTWDNSNNMKGRISPTAYAQKAGAWTSDSNKTSEGAAAGLWWLRSPGDRQDLAVTVMEDGTFNYIYVNSTAYCVRPALWISLESGIF